MINEEKTCGDIDTKLMLQVKQGDAEAYTTLYENHLSSVKRYFKQFGKADGYSEDLAQEVFIRIWHKRKTFRENSTFKAFLNGFTRRVLNEHRRNLIKDSKLAKKKALSQNQIDSFTPEKVCLYAEQIKKIEMNKSKLSEKQRKAINSPETNAKQAHCSNNTNRKRKFDARRKPKNI